MKLVRLALGAEVHVASRQGAVWMNKNVPTAKCNPKKAFFELCGHYTEFEGDVSQITCKKCLKSSKSQTPAPTGQKAG